MVRAECRDPSINMMNSSAVGLWMT
uniref:Uncharacterized protein n=1 Tax=Arundo donax TaxID=35708 RepID=A0A0A9U8W9_ARUDO